MPAVDFKRFNRDSAGLLQFFGQPADFLSQLHGIYELYTNRTIRPRPSPLSTALKNFQVPLPILRHLDMLLAPQVTTMPEASQALITALWADSVFESRLLAAMMLGKLNIPSDEFEQTATLFISQSNDPEILEILLSQGLKRHREHNPDSFLRMVTAWVATHNDKMTDHAFSALVHHAREDHDLNLPEIIKISLPPFRSSPAVFQPTMVDLIGAIYERSEAETIYLVRQLFADPMPSIMPAVFRRITTQLPSDLQPTIIEILREKAPLVKK